MSSGLHSATRRAPRALAAALLPAALAGCEPRPTAPAVPADLFLMRWSVQGASEEIVLGKDDALGRLDGDCGGALCPAGVDGDLLDVLLGDPFIALDAKLGRSWADTVQLSLPGQGVVREIITWTISANDTLVQTPAGTFDDCMKIRRESDQEKGDAAFLFAPVIGLVAVRRNDDRFLVGADLIEPSLAGNETRDGVRFSDDYLPLAVGNQWTFELRGSSESVQQSYRID